MLYHCAALRSAELELQARIKIFYYNGSFSSSDGLLKNSLTDNVIFCMLEIRFEREDTLLIVRGKDLIAENGRTAYPLGAQRAFRHFVSRVTTPENPFVSHFHEDEELWFILEGEATVTLGGEEYAVGEGDLVVLLPRVEHGLSTRSRVRWLCLG